ncbi:hypothetical protein HHI36_012433 [Cryptolaemus montrouzieri]|uniref:Cytochrome b561 domain-containing protein n=1 Tax=Cryptolaemus montrouzieri TaxID=559131 RepID=A0ABD2NEG3_9CUCU
MPEEDESIRPQQEIVHEQPKINKFAILFTIMFILGVATTVLTFHWCYAYHKGFSLESIHTEFNWHPLLSVIGFLFLYANALLFSQVSRYLPKWFGIKISFSNEALYWVIFITKIIVFVFIVLSIIPAVDYFNFNKYPIPHMYSLHSWLGVLALVLMITDVLLGLICFVWKRIPKHLNRIFSSVGFISSVIAFMTSVCTSVLGWKEFAIFTYGRKYGDLANGAITINLLGLVTMAFGLLVLHLLLRKKKMAKGRTHHYNQGES